MNTENEATKLKFSKLKLDSIFGKLKKIKCDDHRVHYCLADSSGNDVAQIVFLGKSELHIEIDNFPSQKKYYQSSFPIRSNDEFIHEMSRVGLVLELTK